jgi:hypothetical protein
VRGEEHDDYGGAEQQVRRRGDEVPDARHATDRRCVPGALGGVRVRCSVGRHLCGELVAYGEASEPAA